MGIQRMDEEQMHFLKSNKSHNLVFLYFNLFFNFKNQCFQSIDKAMSN